MKKKLIHEIDATVAMLPERWEKQTITTLLSGADANLCVVGKGPYDPEKHYEFQSPVFIQIPHRERIKDGVKKFGKGFIGTYIRQTLLS